MSIKRYDNGDYFEFATKITATKEESSGNYPICLGLAYPEHTVRRFAERGGTYSTNIFMSTLKIIFSGYSNLINTLLDAHQESEETKKDIVVRFFNGKVYVLQNAGFVDYTEAFDVVTYYDEKFAKRRFHTNENDIVFFVYKDGRVVREKANYRHK